MLLPSIFGEDLFDDFMNDVPFLDNKDEKKLEKWLYGRNRSHLMKTDIREEDKGYEMAIELPGFKKEDIKVSLNNGYLNIQASKNMDSSKDSKIGTYIRRERYVGSCQRSFYVGEGVEPSGINAEFKHGVLKLYIPKVDTQEVKENHYIAIE